MDLPLAGLLVADLTQNVAGPYCTQILGDIGAHVVKIERPGRGDDARAWAPPYWGAESAAFTTMNRNKRSLAVDMKAPEGRAILERLIDAGRRARPVAARRGRRGAGARVGGGGARNPRLVYCSITAFGTEGPFRDRPGYDPLMQAYGGIMSITGHAGAPPARVPVSLVDMATGLWAVTGVMAALRERDRTGRGAHVTTALFDTALAWTTFQMANYLGGRRDPAPAGLGHADDRALRGLPDARRLGDDRRRLGRAVRGVRRARGARAGRRPALQDETRSRPAPRGAPRGDRGAHARASTDDVLARLEKAGVPSAPILTLDKVAAQPQTEASGMLSRRSPHPRLPDYRAMSLPIKWDGERPPVTRVPPRPGGAHRRGPRRARLRRRRHRGAGHPPCRPAIRRST